MTPNEQWRTGERVIASGWPFTESVVDRPFPSSTVSALRSTDGDCRIGLRWFSGPVPVDVPASLGEQFSKSVSLGRRRGSPLLFLAVHDVADHDADAFSAWYESEHMRLLLSCEGIWGATRWRSLLRPRFITHYSVDDSEVLSPEVRAFVTGTDWASRVRSLGLVVLAKFFVETLE